MVSNNQRSIEGVRKSFELTRDSKWVALFADNLGDFAKVFAEIRAQIGASDPTEAQVMDACREAYRRVIIERINREVLFSHATTFDQFELHGLQRLGRQLYDEITRQIQAKSWLRLQLLVLGFDSSARDKRCLFGVTNRGEVYDCSSVGYHAIGSGAPKAFEVFDQIDFFNHTYDANSIVYWLLAARFAAQNVTSVGHKNTNIFSIDSTGMWSSMWLEDVERLRSIWLAEKRHVPRRALNLIRESFLIMPQHDIRGFQLASKARRK